MDLELSDNPRVTLAVRRVPLGPLPCQACCPLVLRRCPFSLGFQENVLLRFLGLLSMQRWPWLALVGVVVLLEGGALFLQHGLHVEPCNECIYIRAGVAGVGVAGLIAALAPRFIALRLAALAVWSGALAWGLYRANLLLNLEQIVRDGGQGSCARFKGFPSWMPLETWFPDMFEPRAMCGEVSWTFLGQSVTMWIWVTLWLMALMVVLILLAQWQLLGQSRASGFRSYR
jgi:protein dithiol:quinone oxidoreductase